MAAVTLTLIGFFAFIILRVSRPDMGVLFSDLSMQDSASVVRELDRRGIRYATRGDAGQTILAPRPDLAKLRTDLPGVTIDFKSMTDEERKKLEGFLKP